MGTRSNGIGYLKTFVVQVNCKQYTPRATYSHAAIQYSSFEIDSDSSGFRLTPHKLMQPTVLDSTRSEECDTSDGVVNLLINEEVFEIVALHQQHSKHKFHS